MRTFYHTLIIVLFTYGALSAQWVDGGTKLTTSDNVGIGTHNPIFNSVLDVFGDNSAVRGIAVNGQRILDSDNYNIFVGDLAGGDGMRGLILRAGDQDRIFVKENGNVGISTPDPDARLTVKGDIHTQEIKLDLNGAVAPDFVFEPEYNLRTLTATEKYIKENKHLPGIPSAAEMEENGIQLKAMNLKLLQKIEELTLYTIQQQKEIEALKKEINTLKINKK